MANQLSFEEDSAATACARRTRSFSSTLGRVKSSLKQLFKRESCTSRHHSYGPGELQPAAELGLAEQLPERGDAGHGSAGRLGVAPWSFSLKNTRCNGGDDARRSKGDLGDPESARSSACASVFSTRLSAAAGWDAPVRSGSSFLGAFSTAERAAAVALDNDAPQSAPGRLSGLTEAAQPPPQSGGHPQHRTHSSAHRQRRPVQVVVVLEEDEEDEEDALETHTPHRALTMPSLSAPAASAPSRAASSTLAWATNEGSSAAGRNPRPAYSASPRSATHSTAASRRGSSGAATTGGGGGTSVTAAAYVAAMRLRGTTGGMSGGGGGGLVRSPSVTGDRRRPSLSRFGITETAAGRSMSMTLARPPSLGLSANLCSPSSPSGGAVGAEAGGSHRAVSLPAVSSFGSLSAALLNGSSLVAVPLPAPVISAAAPEGER